MKAIHPAVRHPLGLLTLILATAWSLPASSAEAPRGLPAEVHRVEASHLDSVLSAVGRLRANESIILRAEISGRIEQILFREGEKVNQGQELIRLDSASYEAELAQAQAQVNLSRAEYQRAADLLERRVGSQNDRDTKLAQLRVHEAQMELARTRLDKTRLRAPFEGVIGLRQVSPGDFISSGQDLVEVTDFSQMKADFSVPERFLSQLAVGQNLLIEVDALPGERFQGEIYAIAPSSSARSHNIQIRARIPNPDGRLRPGLFANIRIIIGENPQALMIPEQAIVPLDNQFYVMRMNEQNQVNMVPVTLGERRFGEVEIRSGIQAGDVIVTAGQIKLRPGMPITPIFPQSHSTGSDA
ncbi:efflux RND transporter periplasmic adaptor subunit [Nitrincola tapanii]|uniref:Efflux RND transporter periplasmic adaptor subunit n=1 Tax=Nitrincola tapanii TaxID=1708751 RepID=A0A5A9W577_9GAMM|nr:efflux RND transporter periplasmic adaptor subunit [Nitrincola tapanii]KAA0875907.1 efflux RND transporter periplasmic adaptor subunit [Nitrincola tapanii]